MIANWSRLGNPNPRAPLSKPIPCAIIPHRRAADGASICGSLPGKIPRAARRSFKTAHPDMSKNILYCTIGTVLGFLIGFFVANTLTRPGAPVAATTPAAPAPGGEARPLGPDELGGELPPNHPDVGGATAGGGSAAATSP